LIAAASIQTLIQESNEDIQSQNSSNLSSKDSSKDKYSKKLGAAESVSAIKRVDEEEVEVLECDVQRREKDDKDRLANVKSLFFQLNEKFE
jgi:hypothetical protein